MATNTYVALQTTTLTSNVTTVTLDLAGITGYTDLRIVMTPASSSGTNGIRMRVGNGTIDTGSNYSGTYLDGNGSTAASWRSDTPSNFNLSYRLGIDTAFTQLYTIDLMNYANTTTYKSILVRYNSAAQAAGAGVLLWRSTSAINKISFNINTFGSSTGDFLTGSTFTVYGIAAAAPLTAKATGGTIYYGADGYVYHKFTGSGTFTPSSALSADILVVGGGGGGGTSVGGGGGGGGLLGFTSQSLTTTGYTVTIGAGGTAVGSNTPGNDGTSSQFGALTAALGGGGGGSYGGSRAGNPGGSGGGGCGWTTASNSLGGAGTSGQGFAGGNGGGPYGSAGSGGGGGAGSVGQSWISGTVGSSGGRGSAAYSSWAQITGSGVAYNGDYYFAAGGPGVYGAGGTQAAASYGTVAFGGTSVANSGQGGCGDYGYAGGSGIVIVRYLG